jgi:hypothetical protein
MNLPSFTAEASVYNSNRRYSTGAMTLTGGDQVVPMLACEIPCTVAEGACSAACEKQGGGTIACHTACTPIGIGCKLACQQLGPRRFAELALGGPVLGPLAAIADYFIF